MFGTQSCWNETAAVSVTVGAAPTTPAIPTGLAGTTPDAAGDYTVSWDTVSGATSYQLQEGTLASEDAEPVWAVAQTVQGTTRQTFRQSAPGHWAYRVKACNAASTPCSNWSEPITVAVPGPPAQPAAPTLTPEDKQLRRCLGGSGR